MFSRETELTGHIYRWIDPCRLYKGINVDDIDRLDMDMDTDTDADTDTDTDIDMDMDRDRDGVDKEMELLLILRNCSRNCGPYKLEICKAGQQPGYSGES